MLKIKPMDSRTAILETIKRNQPVLVPLPLISLSTVSLFENPVQQFTTVLERIGATWTICKGESEMEERVKQLVAGKKQVIRPLEMNIDAINGLTANALKNMDIAILEGSIGVAENAAIWVTEETMQNRLVPFICEHLLLLIRAKNIVSTMHHAYEQINTGETGFGVFIAGPSKTADIEQSLVIGAHGPVSLEVIIMDY
jgi:L-lactate dehydrogenase complex protein LldG